MERERERERERGNQNRVERKLWGVDGWGWVGASAGARRPALLSAALTCAPPPPPPPPFSIFFLQPELHVLHTKRKKARGRHGGVKKQ